MKAADGCSHNREVDQQEKGQQRTKQSTQKVLIVAFEFSAAVDNIIKHWQKSNHRHKNEKNWSGAESETTKVKKWRRTAAGKQRRTNSGGQRQANSGGQTAADTGGQRPQRRTTAAGKHTGQQQQASAQVFGWQFFSWFLTVPVFISLFGSVQFSFPVQL